MAEEIPPGSVYITPKQMWEAVEEIRKSVDRLTAIVDPSLQDLRANIAALTAKHDREVTALDVRTVALEKQAWSSKWVPALISGVLCSSVAAIVTLVITRSLTMIAVQ